MLFQKILNIEGVNVVFKIFDAEDSKLVYTENGRFGARLSMVYGLEGVHASLEQGLNATRTNEILIYGAFIYINEVPVMAVSVKVLKKYKIAIPHGIQRNVIVAKTNPGLIKIKAWNNKNRENKIYLSLYLHMFWSYYVKKTYPGIDYLFVKPVGSMKHILLNRMGKQYSIQIAIGMRNDMYLDNPEKMTEEDITNQKQEYKQHLEEEIEWEEFLIKERKDGTQQNIAYETERIKTKTKELNKLLNADDTDEEKQQPSYKIKDLKKNINRIKKGIVAMEENVLLLNAEEKKLIEQKKILDIYVINFDYIIKSPTFKSLIKLRESNLLFNSPFDYHEKDKVIIYYTDKSSKEYSRKDFKNKIYSFGGEHFNQYHWGDGINMGSTTGAGVPYVTVKIQDLHDKFEKLLTCEEPNGETKLPGYRLRF